MTALDTASSSGVLEDSILSRRSVEHVESALIFRGVLCAPRVPSAALCVRDAAQVGHPAPAAGVLAAVPQPPADQAGPRAHGPPGLPLRPLRSP
jgi:hypothetical protein